MMEQLIQFNNVKLTFYTKTQKIKIFKDLNMTIDKGEFLTIVGPSGKGKSTMLNLISGFIKPNAGEIFVEGKNLVKMSDSESCKYRNRKIGYIFQAFNLIPQFNVRDNVSVPLLLNGMDKSAINIRINELLERVNMKNRELEYPNTLSGGEQQRVAFARALANSPDIILADEPTGNLDTRNGLNIIEMLYELYEKEGKTIICVSHDDRLRERAARAINIEDITCVD